MMAYRFLVVDDTSFMRKMAADCLREFGYEVAGEASNGKEAVRLYEELKPDVVLMDLNMPEMSGNEAIQAILAINSDAVVLICSASNQKELILEAMDAGAKGYLMKPFNSNRLQEVIRKYAEPYLTPLIAVSTEENEGESVDEKTDEQEAEMAVAIEMASTLESIETSSEASDETSTETKNGADEQNAVHTNPSRGNGKLKSFISSFMCHWQEERDGETIHYSAVCTESENQLLIERRNSNDEKQVIPFTLDGFRELAGWLDNHLKR